jgi:DNA-binding NarL/FixJ family response regulator
MIGILIADDQRSFAEVLAIRLDVEPDLQVVAAVGRPEDGLRVTRAHSVDVAVVNVDGGDDFVALGGQLQALRPGLELVAVSAGDDDAVLARAVREGFRGWVSKDSGVQSLLDVLRAVCRGETCIPPLLLTGLLRHLLQEQADQGATNAPIASLTARELQVLRAMSNGAARQDIAEQLSISPNTVRTHMQSVLTKLGVHTSLAAVRLARSAGVT